MSGAAHPTGEQYEIRRGPFTATVTEVGAGLRSFARGEWNVLDGFAAEEVCTGGRGQLLLPWPNRVDRGRYEWEDYEHHLALTEPAQTNAIHGLVRWSNWTLVDRAEHSVALALRLHAQPGWPWVLDLRVEYELDDEGLTVRVHARNCSAQPCPYATGAHPYLTLGGDTIDAAELTAPGTRYMTTDERQIPTGSQPVEGTPFDFTKPRAIGATKLDTGFSDLRRDGDGLARVTLSGARREVSLWLSESYPFLMLFTGDTLGQPARRRVGLGVEPMTAAPNAFNSGEGLITLESAQQITTVWGIAASVR
ncbi:MAG: aldose 1-epimerase family protein [Solirubrobacteraceae bacterium]